MKFTRETTATVTIRSVADDELRIGDQTWTENVVLGATGVIGPWRGKPVAELTADDFSDVLAAEPELIVLGTGKTQRIPPRELVFAMARRGVGLEVMDTRAAARTFNVLAGEDRRVAAVLYL